MRVTILYFAAARERGVRATCDMYPYEAGSTYLSQLLPPWVAEGATSWGFVIRMDERRIRQYLDDYFNGPFPDYAPFYYTPVPDAHYGLLSAVAFEMASMRRRVALTSSS